MRYVYPFDHSHDRPPREMRDLLGGKGANLAEMTSVLGLPVPPGFTITTEACRRRLAEGGWPQGLESQLVEALVRLEERAGRRLGDPEDPLLVSVRSGARHSMPGMMDTVLDLGLNDESVRGLARQTGDERFAKDSYRRLIQMFAKVVLGVGSEELEERMEGARLLSGARHDAEIPAHVLEGVIEELKGVVVRHTGDAFSQEPMEQLRSAIDAVFRSWDSPRARAYRDHERIDHALGTAVNVQMMVFGNRDERSATGVGFTRDPATGEPGLVGDFLVQAQGEDVVAGSHRTRPLSEMAEVFPQAHQELVEISRRLEAHYRDMLDTEFTIEQERLWILQTRVGKRTGAAALRLAVAMTEDPAIRLTKGEALQRVRAEHLDQVLHDQFDETSEREVLTRGLGASPGAAVGRAYFTADDAVAAHGRGEPVILVRNETSPDDVHGMQVAEGILTARGGLVSHAAVVARGWGTPAVVGAALSISGGSFSVGSTVVAEGDVISIDGHTGEVVLGEVGLTTSRRPAELDVILAWADEVRGDRVSVLANADTAADAALARSYGAEGIGLCRTEHMFLGERLPLVQRVILASDPDAEREALESLLVAQRDDFIEVLEAMDGLPVTVRLLDAPLHEFLPQRDALLRAQHRGELDEEGRELLRAVESWREVNPMLGSRGIRLAFLKPGLYTVQVRALMQALVRRVEAGGDPQVEIMVPLLSTRAELWAARFAIEEAVEAARAEAGAEVRVRIGAMIETPRAALVADEIAELADFVSLGTNDLTQMTFGFSRDDVESRVVPLYLDEGILVRNPFEVIDSRGVGELVALATERARSTHQGIKVSVCGEHAGDPESIAFLWQAGVDAVSCSPFRVPVARLAVAQAALAHERG